jgi:hypothetical protein
LSLSEASSEECSENFACAREYAGIDLQSHLRVVAILDDEQNVTELAHILAGGLEELGDGWQGIVRIGRGAGRSLACACGNTVGHGGCFGVLNSGRRFGDVAVVGLVVVVVAGNIYLGVEKCSIKGSQMLEYESFESCM